MNTLLIEDERLAVTHLQNLLRKHPDVRVIGVVASVAAGIEWLGSHPAPDLIFSDIQLEDGLSFEIFDAVPVRAPLIFTTSFNEYALKAFQLLSVDYLLKPIQAKDLARALEKHAYWLTQAPAPQQPGGEAQLLKMQQLLAQFAPAQPSYRQRFLITAGEQLLPVAVEEIAYFYTLNEVVYLVRHDGRKFTLEHTLEKLESLLDPATFFRLNRQYLASLKAIGKIHSHFLGKLKLELLPPRPDEVLVSRDRAPLFKRWLE
ncbi:LytR/AlgR family response regulator transcription factor [Hymenobacter caeli]|uniref:DNA-binding LytR/AlgR family response regulator n=1 Tax=Hymenobacter caeli TaxID=2735894 RepID=A0ABX2FW12_9BACT|nr:LytTR family DNA-binding domain-containing protein [Hymenobacter caeli]NRT21157.1 DNA-binding LytR/AlgR family response regulator [Hymenobacter caeli]